MSIKTKWKKYSKILLTVTIILMLAFSCIAFSSCAYSPADRDEWYIESIDENGVHYSAPNEDYYNGTLLSSDYMTFAFTKDGLVTITDLNGNVLKGTFTEKKQQAKTLVTVNLSDGTILNGSCARYAFDGVWYEFTLENDEISYNLIECNEHQKEKQKGVILKDIYPDIAQLAADDILEIDYKIENAEQFTLTGEESKKTYLKYFSTASFIAYHYGGLQYYPINSKNCYPTELTVKTDTSEYTLPLLMGKWYEKVYIKYDSEYYALRGDFAEWLLGFFPTKINITQTNKTIGKVSRFEFCNFDLQKDYYANYSEMSDIVEKLKSNVQPIDQDVFAAYADALERSEKTAILMCPFLFSSTEEGVVISDITIVDNTVNVTFDVYSPEACDCDIRMYVFFVDVSNVFVSSQEGLEIKYNIKNLSGGDGAYYYR